MASHKNGWMKNIAALPRSIDEADHLIVKIDTRARSEKPAVGGNIVLLPAAGVAADAPDSCWM